VTATWSCPRCGRRFTQVNQRHACGTGNSADVLRGRPPAVVRLYRALEAFAKSLGPVELVTRERYVLLRTSRIFADAVVMTDALRLVIHLPRALEDPGFEKVVAGPRHVSHVIRLRRLSDFPPCKPWLREAHAFSLAPASGAPKARRTAPAPARRKQPGR
jgi:hypothetical protein